MLMRVVVGRTKWVHIGGAEYLDAHIVKALLRAESCFNADLLLHVRGFSFSLPEAFYREFCKDLDAVRKSSGIYRGLCRQYSEMYFLLPGLHIRAESYDLATGFVIGAVIALIR